MHVILSLGGSLINTERGIDEKFLGEIRGIVTKSGFSFGIVTGGGKAARAYANAVREKGGSEFDADEEAIKATKENGKALIKALGDICYGKVCDSFDEARKNAPRYKAVVMGGTIPGITTDTDAALLAEALGAKRLVNISNVEAIYDSDPKKNPNAKRFERLSYDSLIRLACQFDTRKAGENFVFDILACKIIARSKIEAHFVTGRKMEDVKAAIDGKKHGGTVVKEEVYK